MANEHITLRTVARAAKVSVSTASYALRDDPRVRPAMRTRILAIARQLGYRPNPIFSAMMIRARRSSVGRDTGDVIAYVSGFANEAEWRRAFPQSEMFAGAQARGAALNFRLELFFPIQQALSGGRFEQVLRTRGIRALIVAPFPRGQPQRELHLEWSRYALATIGFTFEQPMLHRVTADHFSNLRLALDEARRAGFQRIGCVLPRAISPRIDQQWWAAWGLRERDRASVKSLPAFIASRERLDAPALRRWFRVHRPDFIVTRGDELVEQLRGLFGSACPPLAELSLSEASACEGGVSEQNASIGATAVDLVISQLQHNEYGIPLRPTLTLIPGEWKWTQLLTKGVKNPRAAARGP